MAIDAAELERVIETHQRMVFSIALRLTGDYGLAEEVAQDVFLDFFRSAEKLRGTEHARFWLRRVAVHRATDALRHRSRQPEAIAEEWVQDGHDIALEQSGGAQASAGVWARIEELLLAIPEPLRVAVILRYQEDMAPEEIAELLVQPVATVKSHLQRGLQLLRKKAAVTMKEYIR
jgi:RNA polymerase sigma-70 factor (ECF subfamily)